MNHKNSVIALLVVALIAVLVAIAHASCIYFGTECYRAQMAPEVIVESSVDGTLLAPLGTMLASLLFFVCAGYALSSARIIRSLPLLTVAVYTISTLCIFRGFVIIADVVFAPQFVTLVNVLVSGIWFSCGLLLVSGHRTVQNTKP